jgi:cytochrome c oxidase assembly protein subunit 15
MDATPLVDLAPALRLAGLAAVVALLPLTWVWLRARRDDTASRIAALTAVTMFLTFDLMVFGSFTRLTDSGLGCPDWPGCYGEVSPIGAHADIHAAQTAMPTGPVTFTKAWIEMIHRYLAMTVGVLILVMCAVSWAGQRGLPHSPWWPTATLAWVIVQGLFGKYTVTLKLYPAIVTLHLLGGALLLALLVVQHETWRGLERRRLALGPPLRAGASAATALLWLQVALGGWVSTNYAVLACRGFPQCNGQWWPDGMAFGEGFTLLRELGRAGHGGFLSLDALVAIHFVHRVLAVLLVAAIAALAVALWRRGEPALRRYAVALGLLTLAQVASGMSNVVLDWPIAGALAHAAGAAGLVGVTTSLLARAAPARRATAA